MAKTVIEAIELELNFNQIKEVEIIEIFCGFNDAKEKVVYSGDYKLVPDYLKDLRFTSFVSLKGKLVIKYTNKKSFEGRKIQQQLQCTIQRSTQSL